MTSPSEQVAWQLYARLPAEERRAVDTWRSLGNDLTTSLLNSGALGGRRHSAGDPSEMLGRMASRDKEHVLQLVAEHEAAHAVVAQALRLGPVTVEIRDDMSGVTRYAKSSRKANAIVAAAAEVWITQFRYHAFPGGDRDGCRADWRDLIANTYGDMDVLDAQRRAHAVLSEYREDVIATAYRLAQDRHLILD